MSLNKLVHAMSLKIMAVTEEVTKSFCRKTWIYLLFMVNGNWATETKCFLEYFSLSWGDASNTFCSTKFFCLDSLTKESPQRRGVLFCSHLHFFLYNDAETKATAYQSKLEKCKSRPPVQVTVTWSCQEEAESKHRSGYLDLKFVKENRISNVYKKIF